MGLYFHAFPINSNALIVYFTEKLDPWEFSDELLLLLLGAALMSLIYIIEGLCNLDTSKWLCKPVFSKRQHTGCKKEKNLLVMPLELSQKGITVRVQLFCSWGKGLVIHFGKDFYSLNLLVGHFFGLWCIPMFP